MGAVVARGLRRGWQRMRSGVAVPKQLMSAAVSSLVAGMFRESPLRSWRDTLLTFRLESQGGSPQCSLFLSGYFPLECYQLGGGVMLLTGYVS